MKLYAWLILVWIAVLFILPADVQDIVRRLLDDQLILQKHLNEVEQALSGPRR